MRNTEVKALLSRKNWRHLPAVREERLLTLKSENYVKSKDGG
jgi:hypothetical protein